MLTVTSAKQDSETSAQVAELLKTTFPAEGAINQLGSAINGQS